MKRFLLLLIFHSLALQAQINIYPDGPRTNYNLSGADGSDGPDGKRAYTINCDEFPGQILDGVEGSPGEPGENGENGQDVIIHFENFNQLSDLQLDLEGGKGGQGGRGGAGSIGCNGGKPGASGQNGSSGLDGRYGEVYLNHISQKLPDFEETKIIDLSEFVKEEIFLSYLSWDRHEGLKDIIDPESNVQEHFYTFEQKVEKKIVLDWRANTGIHEILKTKVAIHFSKKGFHLNVYRGALLEYFVEEGPSEIKVVVYRVAKEESFQNLDLGRMRNQGTDLMLEVKEKYNLSFNLNTYFDISLVHIQEGSENSKLIGHFRIDPKHVRFDDKNFHIYIGKLNYPSYYKKKGVKLRVYLSVYRESPGQRRSYVLSGIFRI